VQAAEPLPPTEPQDSGQTAEALLRLELLLNLSFGSCVVLYVGFFVTGIAMVKAGPCSRYRSCRKSSPRRRSA